MTWKEISVANRKGMGYEKIARNALSVELPAHVTPDVNLLAFRFYGNAPMVGYRVKRVFHILFLDRDFTLYDHG